MNLEQLSIMKPTTLYINKNYLNYDDSNNDIMSNFYSSGIGNMDINKLHQYINVWEIREEDNKNYKKNW